MENGEIIFNKLTSRGKEFLGVEYPVLGGAMSWISNSRLVAAISNAGGFGVLAGGNMPIDLFIKEVEETKKLTDKPFGLNMITISPAFKDQVDYACSIKFPVVIFAGGLPPRDAIRKVKEAGCKLICFAPSIEGARLNIKMGCDALIIEGHEAGGHIGPVSTSVLAEQILPEVKDIPVFVAGGIGSGFLTAHYLLMGAAGVQLGTRFAVTEESPAHDNFKQAYVKAHAKDVQPCAKFDPRVPVIPVRSIVNDGVRDFTALQLELIKKIEQGEMNAKDAGEELEKFWLGALRKAVIDGDVDHGSMMAGQSINFVREIKSVAAVIDEIRTQASEELERVMKIYK